MSQDTIDSFLAELWRLIESHRDEWEIMYAEVVGYLELTKTRLMREFEDDEEVEESDQPQLPLKRIED